MQDFIPYQNTDEKSGFINNRDVKPTVFARPQFNIKRIMIGACLRGRPFKTSTARRGRGRPIIDIGRHEGAGVFKKSMSKI